MTTDLAVSDQGGQLATTSVTELVSSYASDLKHCMDFAAEIVDTEIVPPSFWPAVAILVGDEAKILKPWEWDPRRKHPKESPEDYGYRRRAAIATTGGVVHVGATMGHKSYYQSITGIYFVGGRPALMSEEMRAQVLHAGHHLRVVTRTDTVAEVEAARRGDRDTPRRYVFTIENAIQAGYVQGKGPNAGNDKWGKPKKGGNPKYDTDPATMLVARATTIACRLEFPDVIRGMVAAELVDDDRPTLVEVQAEVVEQPARRATAAAILGHAVQAEPAPGESAREKIPADFTPAPVAPPDAPVTRAVLPVSAAQTKRLAEQYRALGIGSRGKGDTGARLALARHVVERDIGAPSELTADEADRLIAALDERGAELAAEVLGLAPTPTEADPAAVEQAFPDVPVEDPPAEPEGWQQ